MYRRVVSIFSFFIVLILFSQIRYSLFDTNHLLLFVVGNSLMLFLLARKAIKTDVIHVSKWQSGNVKVIALGALAWLIQDGLESIFGPANSGSAEFFSQADHTNLLLAFEVMLFGPIIEELIFRGLLQGGALNHSHLGILLTSAIFALTHFPYDFLGFLPYFLAGILFGYLYKYTDNIWIPIAFHMFNNILAYCL